jgi:hypothetical protein
MSLVVAVRRRLVSLEYRRDPGKPADWGNNDANNSLDVFEVYEASDLSGISGVPIFTSRAQTVANMEGLEPDLHYDHTVAPGEFALRAFVNPRLFYGRIHGICNTRTIAGDWIGAESTIAGNLNRWLVHDWQKHRDKAPPREDTRVAWSAGCFVMPDHELEALGNLFDHQGIVPGTMIPGMLVEGK